MRKSPRLSRRERGFATLGYLSAGALLISANYLALKSLSDTAREKVDQWSRRPGPYTQSPTRIYRGQFPGRDPHGRGGMWSPSMRERIKQTQRFMGLHANAQGSAPTHTVAVDEREGSSLPWEGSVGGTNTGNGNKLTSLNLLSWKMRGGNTVDFTLFHNSQSSYNDELGYHWSWSYDVYINNLTGSPIVHWGDGTAIPFTAPGGGSGGGGDTPILPSSPERFAGMFAGVGLAGALQSSTTYTAPAGIYDSLVKNADNTWTLTKKGGTKYSFNTAGFLTKIEDTNGNAITLTLNTANYVTKIAEPGGRYLDISLDSGNNFTAITDHTGRSWSFTRNSSDDLVAVTWPTLNGTTYTDGFSYTDHRIVTQTDRRGKNWTFAYATNGSLISETTPLSATTTYTYGSSGTTITDPLSHTLTHNYASGKLASQVDGAGFSVAYTARDANNNVTSTTDARGKVWTSTFDSKGNVLTSTNPLGKTTTYTYNSLSRPLTVTDPLGNVTTNSYDSNGNLLTTVDALGKTVATNVYGSYGLLSSSTNALGKTSTVTYNTLGLPETVTDPTGIYTTLGYDSLGRPTSVTDAAGKTTTTAYDVWDRTVSVTHPVTSGSVGASVSTNYLPTGQTSSVTNELGKTNYYAYDDAGRVTSVTNARGDIESYGYDAASRRTSVTNGRGKTRTYTFTNRGEVSSLTLPDGAVESWSYDGSGNTTGYTNPLSQTILYVFNDAGQQTSVDYPAGTDTTFAYDNAGRRTSMVDATGTTSWNYDAASRVTTFTSPQGSQTSGYNDAGYRTSLTGTGISRTWTYDDAGRVLSLTNENSETTTFQYNSLGKLWKTTLPGSKTTTVTYDARGRETLRVYSPAVGSAWGTEAYVYDDANNLLTKTYGGTQVTTYTYDNIDQLLTEVRSGTVYSPLNATYTYDGNGNRASTLINGTTQNYGYDDGDKLTSITQGSSTVKSYGYDAAGRTTSVTTSAGTTTLAYDYESRVSSITYPGTGGTNTFAYNGLDTRVGKVDNTGTFTYRRDGAGVLAPVLSDGAAVYTPGVSQRRGSTTTYDIHDRLGTATRQTNDANTGPSASRTYDAFGNLNLTSGTAVGPFGFAGAHGYEQDSQSGLKLLGHRYYDSTTGRFLTRDPIKDGRNWYAYCANNPLKAVDATGGMFIICDGTGIPPNMGFDGEPSLITLPRGTIVYDRSTPGRPSSDFFAPTPDDLANCGLPPTRASLPTQAWEIAVETEVFAGPAIDGSPYYGGQGGPGGGRQYWTGGTRLPEIAEPIGEPIEYVPVRGGLPRGMGAAGNFLGIIGALLMLRDVHDALQGKYVGPPIGPPIPTA